MFVFCLIKKCLQSPSDTFDPKVDFLLEEDEWDDYNYHTTYHLHITGERVKSSQKPIYLGPIHIMKLSQEKNEKYLIRKELSGKNTFSSLPVNFYSISFSIDMFKGLAKYLTPDERKELIEDLRLILREDDKFYPIVENDDCFITSLLRDGSMSDFSLQKGRELLLQESMLYDLRQERVTIRYADSVRPVTLDFSAIKDVDSEVMPNGIVAFIGKNGSGKSTALYKLASLLYSAPGDRARYMKNLGTIEPSDVGISQLIIFSYSPLDNFLLPGETVNSDLTLWAKGIKTRESRFIYCGLRDVEKEAEIIMNKKGSKDDTASMRIHDVILKKQADLATEGWNAYSYIRKEYTLQDDWEKFLQNMKEGQYELYQIATNLIDPLFPNEASWNVEFANLSSGYKFFFHSMLHIIAYCEENALLLFDEPENHLQPPLLSFMLAEVRKILARRKSVMLIATHSPVVLQETLSKNVRIVRRCGDKVTFEEPYIETFGENFGTISSEVFDLTTDRVQFFRVIDELYSNLGCDKMDTDQEAVSKIESQMGGISSQIIHYIVSKFDTENRV